MNANDLKRGKDCVKDEKDVYMEFNLIIEHINDCNVYFCRL